MEKLVDEIVSCCKRFPMMAEYQAVVFCQKLVGRHLILQEESVRNEVTYPNISVYRKAW